MHPRRLSFLLAGMANYARVKSLSVADAAYIAGLVDGEGTVTLTTMHRLVVSISNAVTWTQPADQPTPLRFSARRTRACLEDGGLRSSRELPQPPTEDSG